MSHVSDIKLIRTDTTLDLSQKAEKGMLFFSPSVLFSIPCLSAYPSYIISVGLSIQGRE
ncbi:hypothetical protein Pint_01167 [Pistacia integerrima]|uniref:Uncharacterized protein n=1 Tax=Pistacia integerrima TaxID=434235 RepID=A0ACC0ZJX0_9ROSI|nr:hypothetical protein Pint_01167 [Pistacia integerrima]